jgi:hypothetical protein
MSEVFPRLFSSTKPAGYTLNNRIAITPGPTLTGNTSFDRRWIMGSPIPWRSMIRIGRPAGERMPVMKTEFQRPRGRAERINQGGRS